MAVTAEFYSPGPGEYERIKKIFDRARHPGFVGRELVYRCTTAGRAIIATIGGADVGVALVDQKQKLVALSVAKEWQGKGGIGSAIMRHMQPKWVSAIGEKKEWFARLGYKDVGAPKVGQNGKHSTQLMQLEGDMSPASEAHAPEDDAPESTQVTHAPEDDAPECAAIEISFRDFCRLMLGTSRARPLQPGEEHINGALLGALVDAFKVCHPQEKPATIPRGMNGVPDPLGLLGDRTQ
jgi:hypothetical protein